MIPHEEICMKLRCSSIATATLALTFASVTYAQTNSFQMVNKAGRVVGKSSYSFSKTKEGYKVSSKYEYRTGVANATADADPNKPATSGANVVDSQLTAEYKVDASGNYLSGYTQNSANQTLTSYSPSKTRDVVIIASRQGGTDGGSKTLPMPKPDFLVAPDYDPSAIQMLITGAIAHPHEDHLYLLLVPASGFPPSNTALYIKIASPTDASGTLDGKAIALKRYPVGWAKATGDFYTDADGNLMQANIGTTGITYLRAKFKLDDKAAAQ
jgi:hypothetical protein